MTEREREIGDRMRVLVAGAGGEMGRPLLRALAARGHEVIGTTRRPERARAIEALGARPLVVDALDADGLTAAVGALRPSHVVHMMTALPAGGAPRARQLEPTNRLRTEGTRNLLRAAIAAGARRVVAQSFLFVYGDAATAEPLDEAAPPALAPRALARTVRALRDLELQLARARQDAGLESVALRFGMIYGPESVAVRGLARRARRGALAFPLAAPGIVSFVHVDDAAAATVAALEVPAPGPVYNVADDAPLSVAGFVAEVAAASGSPAPRSMPLWPLRWLAPAMAAGASMRVPLSNRRLRRELGWRPSHPTVREGLAALERAGALAA